MIIYLDTDFKCYITNDGSRRAIETDFFEDKCQAFIEGYRYVPAGESWSNSKGETFLGEMITPWKNYSELVVAQTAYEKAELKRLRAENAEYESALSEIEAALGV